MRSLSKLTKRLALIRTYLPLGAVLLSACADAAGPTTTMTHDGAPTDIRRSTTRTIDASPSTVSLLVGASAALSATVRDWRGRIIDQAEVTWMSSAPTTATVTAAGNATGVSTGSASIIATSGGATDTVAVQVAAGPPSAVTDLAVLSSSDSSLTLSFTAVSDGAGGGADYVMRVATPTISWGSTPNVTSGTCAVPIATVAVGLRQSCTVTGLVANTAYQVQLVAFRGTWDAVQAFGALSNVASGATLATITPPPSPASVASVSLDRSTASISVGASTTFSATVRDSAGNVLLGRIISWTSANAGIASVVNGLATGIAAGTTDITATIDGHSASATVIVTAVTTPEPPIDGTFFSSDWGHATGNSTAAFLDGGVWTNFYCTRASSVLTVVPGTSVGFTRTANVLRIQHLGDTECGMLEARNAIPLSTSHYGRMYFRNDESATRHNHVMTYFPVGRIQLAVWNRWGFAEGMRPFMRTYYNSAGSDMSYPTNMWRVIPLLAHGSWYRYEWHMEYVTPTTYRLWPRIYDMAGTLLYDADDYLQNDADVASGLHLAAFYAAGNTFGFSDVTLARNFGLGNEGPGPSSNTGGYWYHASLALSTAGWIGQ